jgi:hypothetical protein
MGQEVLFSANVAFVLQVANLLKNSMLWCAMWQSGRTSDRALASTLWMTLSQHSALILCMHLQSSILPATLLEVCYLTMTWTTIMGQVGAFGVELSFYYVMTSLLPL